MSPLDTAVEPMKYPQYVKCPTSIRSISRDGCGFMTSSMDKSFIFTGCLNRLHELQGILFVLTAQKFKGRLALRIFRFGNCFGQCNGASAETRSKIPTYLLLNYRHG
ncbi:hypothetical protein V6N11_010792 [Hibiscus sabdariffa]|uniref:Uncharacterized protein n=1 Tax=Hibiscus sabdariffa TaxID=183260 RepID=A0ABR2S6B4_9ROSI